jgi:iron complex outermembrane receptor protein
LDLPSSNTSPIEGPPSRESTLFEEIPSVYGAAKYDQKVHEAPGAVIIITAEQIRKYGYRNFAQILDSVPGLFTNTDRNYGYIGIRGFNRPGDYTSRILLLIDNHRLNDAVYDQGGSGTETPIDVDLIDRVEVIKGPASRSTVPMPSLGSSMSLRNGGGISKAPRSPEKLPASIPTAAASPMATSSQTG